ncbi:hypothetical protein Tco_0253294, partial [Tanacetum coccineum]
MIRSYTVGSNEKRGYVGPLPYYNKCKLHHGGSVLYSVEIARRLDIWLGIENHRNKAGTNEARGREYTLGGGEANLDSNVVT